MIIQRAEKILKQNVLYLLFVRAVPRIASNEVSYFSPFFAE